MATTTRRRINLRHVSYALAIITFMVSIYVVLFETVEPTPPPAEVFPTGELRIGIDASYPPFAIPTESGLAGMEIDIGNAIGEHLGVSVRFINIGFDGLYDSLSTNQVDILLSQLIVNPLRMSEVFYTRPYFDAGLVLLTDANAPMESMHDLPNHSLAYEFGSDGDNEMRFWQRRIGEFEPRPYELPQHALDAVRLGEADSALVDAITARTYLREHPDWQATYVYVTNLHYAIAIQIPRGDILGAIDSALAELMANGTIPQIIDRWM